MSGIVYKRDGSPFWYITNLRESTKTRDRKKAEEYARTRLREVWDEQMMGAHTVKFAALSAEYLDTKSHKRSLCDDERFLTEFAGFLAKRSLTDATLAELAKGDDLRQHFKQVRLRTSPQTANKHMQCISACFKLAVSRGWLLKAPELERYEVVGDKKPRWLRPEELQRLLTYLPDWVADLVQMATQTGMRWSNVAGLQWEWIAEDWTICTVPATHSKTKRMYTVPISAEARKVLAKWRQLREESMGSEPAQSIPNYVFWNPDRPGHRITSIRFWWKRAFKKSGIPYARPHDLRHTWASWHVQNGTPDRILQTMGGWASNAMLNRYVHLDVEHLTKYADNLNGVKHEPLAASVQRP